MKTNLVCFTTTDSQVVQDVVKEYDQKHRGRELPGFSDYKVFEMVVQKLVMILVGPALDTLKVIRGISLKHSLVFTKMIQNYF